MNCQVPLQTLFDESGLLQDLDSFIQPVRSQKLKINRRSMLEDIFVEYPSIIPYAERIALINLARNLKRVHLNQLNADVQEALILTPQINLTLMHFQNWLKENIAALVKTEKSLCVNIPRNPFLEVFQEYARTYPKYLETISSMRKAKDTPLQGLFSKAKQISPKNDAAVDLIEIEKTLVGIIKVATKLGTALEHIRDLRQNVAHIRKQYNETVQGNPRSAIDLDESIDEYNAVIQSLGELSMLIFRNGMPVQRNYTYTEVKQGA
jgi:hypothetical protein